ncbi:class I SAM-dependent methyltransferase [Streptomyces botrytidirepellens]|uniref:Methyltransferase domain-containing protein n=1 Tax=Streptomyces botrytidirepellens TaxID=2486417 RepID=A0A3M8VMD1_9ACTN|nr:methyltransferase domain-containing protein [Streptomyces botrytidirepellens]RNG18167.1 methyltransferase domain-containing protein [Streptomyces botrytidirepellens]
MDDSITPSHNRVLAQSGAGNWMFLLEAARDIRTTGALAPSGRALAHALTEPVRAQAGRRLNVLEVGAGTGSVTRSLIPQLPAGSRLDIVEANPRFTDRLRHLVRTHPVLTGQPGQARVHHAYVEELDIGHRYDAIISGLPFANFDPHQVDAIMGRYLELLRPGGLLTYFAYCGTRPARTLLSLASRAQARRQRASEEVLADYQRHYATGRSAVWANLPPAHVWQLQRPAERGPGASPTSAGAAIAG